MRAHLPEEREILIIQIQEQINELRSRRVLGSAAIEGWEIAVAGSEQPPGPPPKGGWRPIRRGEHWGDDRPDLTAWFRAKTQVPKDFNQKGSFVCLHLSLAREGLISLNGNPFHGISENHKLFRLTRTEHLKKPLQVLVEAYTEAIRHPAPKYYGKFETAEIVRIDESVDSLCWDLQTALDVLRTYAPQSTHHHRMLDLLSEVMNGLQPFPGDPAELSDRCRKAARRLKEGLKAFPASGGDGRLLVCGHSHIDTAWLWPLRETKRKCGRTFSTILQLMESNPEFTFAQGQPQLYQYTKEHYPEVYAGIRKRIAEGRWDPAGPAWVEMDCNLSGGEAIIRQFLYGNRFLEEEFGVRNNVCWLPDAFGYAWSLPQILRGCEVDVFVTTKIDWSMITKFPYTTFEWEGIDGTRILAMMPPLNYNGNLIPKDCKQQWELIRQKNILDEMVFSFGWGDGGGGPTQEMIENGRRLSNIAGIPKVRFGTITQFFNETLETIDHDRLPVWNGELYLELHRACQITQARTKRFNRKMELLLRETECIAALASLEGSAYPREKLETIWRDVLTNQFHDILPGSSVESLYRETDEIYRNAETRTRALFDQGWNRYESKVDVRGEGTPVLLFNSLGWERSDPALLAWEGDEAPTVVDLEGNLLPSQVSTDLSGEVRLWLTPPAVPSIGHTVVRLSSTKSGAKSGNSLKVSEKRMENDFFILELDAKGLLRRVYDKRRGREVLERGSRGNILQLFHDHPHMHDAWDYDFNVDDNAWVWDDVRSIAVKETGPVRASIEIERRTEKSTLKQRIVLYASTPRIDFETEVDWWEKHILLKAAFPVAVRSPRASYEIQFGVIERATHESTPFDRARFEVPHHRWMDLSEGDYGVAIANDCKYGSDILGNTLRLSLLRSPVHPDPKADEGLHRFTYSLIPHSGDWRVGRVRHHAAELNAPTLARKTRNHGGSHPAKASWISCDAPNIFIETLKREEDGDRLVVRLFEAEGCRGRARLNFGFPIQSVHQSNLVERAERKLRCGRNSVEIEFLPYQIQTLLIKV